MTTLAGLRDNAFGPHLLTDRVRDGVLADVGLAAQELPANTPGALTGYLQQTDATNEHTAMIAADLRSSPSIFKASDLLALRQALLVDGAMNLDELEPGGEYATGNALALQNIGFTPVMGGNDELPSNFDFTATINSILTRWAGRPPFVNCGDANNWQFLGGSFHFNNAFPLRCRASDNPIRPLTNAGEFGVDATGWIMANQQICADTFPGIAGTRLFAKTIYDPLHPDVAALILAHCAGLATNHGADLRYLCHGETTVSLFQQTGSPIEPATNVAAHVVDGFRRYVQSANGLNLTLQQANTRWGSSLASFNDINPDVRPFASFAPGALSDYRRFQTWLVQQLADQQYLACKVADPNISGTRWSFGRLGMERATRLGEFGAVGDWYQEQETGAGGYRVTRDQVLRPIANAAILHGVPGAFPITASTFTAATDWSDQLALSPILRALRNYEQRHVRWLYADLLTAGGCGFGYLFGSPSYSFGPHAPSKANVLGEIAAMVARHPHMLAGCGAYSRVALHIDPADADNWQLAAGVRGMLPAGSSLSARTGYWVHRTLRDAGVVCSVFHDAATMSRPHVRANLERNVTIIPWHPDQATLVDTYSAIAPNGSTGAALFVARLDENDLPEYVQPTPEANTAIGPIYRLEPPNVGAVVNGWVLAVRGRRNCETDDKYARQVGRLLVEQALPYVISQVADSWSAPLVDAPVSVDAAGADVQVNYVTDGINWTVAVTNFEASDSADVDLSISADIATALDVTYAPQSVTVAPGDTQFLAFNATTSALDVPAAIDDAQAKLALIGAGYAASVAQVSEILDHAETLEVSHPSRALALYISAVRAPLVQCTIAAGVATVTVHRLTLVGTGASSEAIDGAEVLAMWPNNFREHGASGTTNASGIASLTLGAPAQVRWDFAIADFAAPPAGAADRIELHVTDPRTCATTRIERANP